MSLPRPRSAPSSRPPLRRLPLTLAMLAGLSAPAWGQADAPAADAAAADSGSTTVSLPVAPNGLGEPSKAIYYRIGQSLRHEDNLFRRAEGVGGGKESDTIATTSLTAGTRLFLGRQVLNAEATVSRSFYQDNDQLDNTGYNLNGRLAWEIGSNLAGGLRVGIARAQSELDQLLSDGMGGGVVRNVRNEQETRFLSFDARYGLYSQWSLETFGDLTDVSYSDASARSRDLDSRTLGVGVIYRPHPDWSYGVRLSHTRGSRPGDDFDRDDLALQVSYRATERTNFSARIAQSSEDHDTVGARDFDGLTGYFTANYQWSAKVGLSAALSRQTNSGATVSERLILVPGAGGVLVPDTALDFLSDSRVTDTLSLSATWAATAKIAVRGGVSYSREDYDRRFAGGVVERGHTTGLNLGASWAVHRIVGLNCNLSHQRRGDIGAFEGYSANSIACSASVALE